MKKLNFLKKTDLGLTILIVIAIIVVINFLSYQIFSRWDLTENKDYSISEASEETVKDLDDIASVKVYFSKNLPKQYINLEQEVKDVLDEYANYANGKINIEIINPENLDNYEEELYKLGIPALQFNVLEKDKYQSIKGYLGIIVQYGSKQEVIPVVENTKNLEYQITSAIKKATSDDLAIIGLVTSNSTLDLQNEIPAAYQKIQELYETKQIDLKNTESISADINTLLILGSKEEFDEQELKAIDAFLMRGGSLLIATDGVTVDNGLESAENETGLNNILESYGVRLNNNLVLDSVSGVANFSTGLFTISTNYPFWPQITRSGFDQDNAAVAKLESALFAWASSVEVLSDKIPEENKISYLIKSSEKSWTQENNFNLDPQQRFNPENFSAQNLAVSIFGKFNSAFGTESTDSGRLILIGDSDFITDGFLRQAPDNLILFQNLVDSLSLDEDLINIRSKGITSRPIKELSDNTKAMIRYANVFSITILVIIFGLGRYFLRKRSKFIDEI